MHSEFIKVSPVVEVVNLSEFVKDLHSKVVPASKLRGQEVVKVVNFSECVQDLRSKVVPASKVVKVVKLRQQSSSAE